MERTSTILRHELAIPSRLNAILVAGVSGLFFLLIWLGGAATDWAELLAIALAFAIVMIPVYSLIHEAEHASLMPRQKLNDALGIWLCLFFGVSFTFFRHCHLRHHRKNRTASEAWDLVTPDQSRWKRAVNLYVMMSGLGYLLIFLSNVFFLINPRLIYAGVFQRHQEIASFLEGSDNADKIPHIRIESAGVIAFHVLLIATSGISFAQWAVLYAVHAFVWSSQNYVNHAFASRDVVHGAHNLYVPRLLTPIYLNFNLHLAHHQHPQVPWRHLPKLVPAETITISFFRNYLRLWGGPRRTTEISPAR